MIERLFVTDLDGTLLRSDESVSAYTADTLNAAIGRGLSLTYCTSRSYFAASRLTAAIGFRLPAIVSGGAFAVDAHSGEILRANILSPDLVAAVLADAAAVGRSPFVFGFNQGRERVAYRQPLHPGQREWIARRRRQGDRRLQAVETLAAHEITYELLFLADERESAAIADSLRQTYGGAVSVTRMAEIYHPGYFTVEIHHREANKAAMLKWLAGRLALSPASITAFGDNLNDLPMFMAAGHRVAVANAHPEVRQAADIVIDANDADGVARYIAAAWGRGCP